MEWVYDDGGRADAGYKGDAGDCAVRAVAIATGSDYQEVYDSLNLLAQKERPRGKRRSSSRTGMQRTTLNRHLDAIGWKWTSTMAIGSGCQVHLRSEELPSGRLIARVSKHYTAVVDGIICDTFDPSRDGTRCVYGYWRAT